MYSVTVMICVMLCYAEGRGVREILPFSQNLISLTNPGLHSELGSPPNSLKYVWGSHILSGFCFNIPVYVWEMTYALFMHLWPL